MKIAKAPLESRLEILVRPWLKSHFGLEFLKRNLPFESERRKDYTIDLYGYRREGWKSSPHFFAINCIPRKVTKRDFINLDKALVAIYYATIQGYQDWCVDYAMIISNIGFTDKGVQLANKKGFGAYLKTTSTFKELSVPTQLYY
ncbi:MAG: hypothetical protein ACE5J2_01385 [Nitrososphaerales archaeon]